MLIPLGTDQPRSRIPRITLAIIIICFVLYPVSFVMRGVMAVPYELEYQYHSLQQSLVTKWMLEQGEPNPRRKYKQLLRKPQKMEETIKEFKKDMEAKKLGYYMRSKYEEWKKLHAEYKEKRKKEFDYVFGYVPNDFRPHTLITNIFVHGGFWHVFWNMFFLYIIGIGLEDIWGRKLYLGFFLVGGMFAVLGHHLFTSTPSYTLVGASGAVSALMGGYLIRFYNAKLRFWFFKWEFWLPAWIVIGFWLGGDIYDALSGIGEESHVAVWGHLGGYAFGIAGALAILYSGFEEKFVAKDLAKQDEIDSLRAAKKEEKKQAAPPRLPEYEEGIKARKLGHFEEARHLIRTAVEQRPHDAEMVEELLRIDMKLENSEGVAEDFGRLIQICLNDSDMDGAFHWYRQFLQATPNTTLAGKWNYRMAMELYKRGHLAHAVAELYRFAAGRPDDNLAPKALHSAAMIQADKMGEPEKAMEAINRLLHYYPQWMPDEVQNTRDRIKKQIQ